MSIQARSYFLPTGIDGDPSKVCRVFFAFDSASLDAQDRSVLDALCRAYDLVLIGRRVELAFVGHADYRGNPEYNQRLGMNRALAVKEHLDGRLASRLFYSSYHALSVGEEHARQPTSVRGGSVRRPSEEEMARDRVVEVFSSYITSAVAVPPLVITAVPVVRRITFRRYVEVKRQGVTGSPDPRRDDERELIQAFLSGRLFDSPGSGLNEPPGSEDARARRVAWVPATHRVNRVVVDLTSEYTVQPGMEMWVTTTDSTYIWGPPQNRVTLELRPHSIGPDGVRRALDPRVRILSRWDADSRPYLFPPAPR